METVDAEIRLAAFVAQILTLEINQRVFCGTLPPGIPEGVTVRFLSRGGEIAGSPQNCVAEVTISCFDRSELFTRAAQLADALPDYGGKFLSLLPQGEFSFSEDRTGGALIHRATGRILASFA